MFLRHSMLNASFENFFNSSQVDMVIHKMSEDEGSAMILVFFFVLVVIVLILSKKGKRNYIVTNTLLPLRSRRLRGFSHGFAPNDLDELNKELIIKLDQEYKGNPYKRRALNSKNSSNLSSPSSEQEGFVN